MSEQPTSTVTPAFIEASAKAAIRALRGLEKTAIMLETYGPECFPILPEHQGKKHFARVIMESAAEEIRKAWAAAIKDVETFQKAEEGNAMPMCAHHPDRVSRTNLDGDELCQECADAWVRGEGQAAAEREAEEQHAEKAP